MDLKKLPELTPQHSLERPLTMMEYYFASIGRSPSSQEGDCEIITMSVNVPPMSTPAIQRLSDDTSLLVVIRFARGSFSSSAQLA